uniref:Protein archease n=1 Tax=Oryctolagus cuniculus TaxID=9986 RepID=A0A5F9D7S4_RABIT
MAQGEEDVRDYNLTEEQKAIKAKYPPVNRKYEYLDHTADVQLHAWGDTLEEAFEQCAMAMFGYMTDTGTVEPLQTVEVETQGDDLQSLLFHFLDEWLYKFSADEFFIPREVKVLNIDQRNFKLRSIGWGEEFSLSKHPQVYFKIQSLKTFHTIKSINVIVNFQLTLIIAVHAINFSYTSLSYLGMLC